jgi:hypothetical protein
MSCDRVPDPFSESQKRRESPGRIQGKISIVFIGKIDGTDLNAFSATGTFCKVYETGFLTNPGGKASFFALEVQKLGIG